MESKIIWIVLVIIAFIGGVLFIKYGGFLQGGDEPFSSSEIVDLSNKGLSAIPQEVLNNTKIRVLYLNGNNLTSLPSEIGKLTNLEELNVGSNKLTGSLPGEIRQLTKLKVLVASNNELTGIPAEIGQMKNLQTLNLAFNEIDSYPNELKNLQNLKVFFIKTNNLSDEKIAEIEKMLPNTEVK